MQDLSEIGLMNFTSQNIFLQLSFSLFFLSQKFWFDLMIYGGWTKSWEYPSIFLFAAETGIILTLATELPTGSYNVVLRVADNLGMEQASTIHAMVCDCSGPDVVCKGLREAGVGLPVILGILGAILLLLSEYDVVFQMLSSVNINVQSLSVGRCEFVERSFLNQH